MHLHEVSRAAGGVRSRGFPHQRRILCDRNPEIGATARLSETFRAPIVRRDRGGAGGGGVDGSMARFHFEPR
jgi:hypothetical protein